MAFNSVSNRRMSDWRILDCVAHRLVNAVVRYKKTRTRPVSPAILATWKGQTRPIIVDVDFVAAGGMETYSYLCVITQGAAFVQRTMN